MRHCGDRLDECAHLLAEGVERAVLALASEIGGFGDPQADLAAAALACAGHAVPHCATVPELEAEVLANLTDDDARTGALQALALAVARLRKRKLGRAAAVGLPIAAAPLVRQRTEDERRSVPMESIFDRVWEAVQNLPVVTQFQAQAEEERRKLGRVNILVAGRSGAGKSTLINSIFRREVTRTAVGRPVTRDITWFEPPGLPIRLCDTRGLEMEAFASTLSDLRREIERANASGRAEDRIHILWLCIDEPSTRVQAGEERVMELCAEHRIPGVVVLTKAIGPRAFAEEVREILPAARDVIRVLAEPWDDDRQPFGLADLVRATEALLPDAMKAAFDAAQQDTSNNPTFERC